MNKQKTAIEIAEAGRGRGNLDHNMHIVTESNIHVLHFYKSVPWTKLILHIFLRNCFEICPIGSVIENKTKIMLVDARQHNNEACRRQVIQLWSVVGAKPPTEWPQTPQSLSVLHFLGAIYTTLMPLSVASRFWNCFAREPSDGLISSRGQIYQNVTHMLLTWLIWGRGGARKVI
jgi:hypothetical protein